MAGEVLTDNMKNIYINKYLNSFLALLLCGCVSAPKLYNGQKKEGSWQARVQVKDLMTNKSEVLSLEVLSIKDEALRMELTGTLGVRVASLLMKDNQIAYAIHTQRKFYSGSISSRSLQPLLKVQLDPKWLYPVFFDEAVKGSDWKCSSGADRLIDKCEQISTKHEIIWSERQGENKRVVIRGDNFEINVLVKDFTTKVEYPDKAFTLEAPATYKRYKLL